MDRTRPSCAAEGEHPGFGSFWTGSGLEGLVHPSVPCDGICDEWDKRVDEYESGKNPLVLCEDAARKKGLKW